MAEFNSTPEGLTSNQVRLHIDRYGLNRVQEKGRQTFLNLFINQFKSAIILILIFATLVLSLIHI